MPQRNAIEVVINAINNTTGVFDEVKKSAQSMGESLANVGANLTALGAPFLALATKAFTAADDWGDALGQLNTVLDSTKNAVGLSAAELEHFAAAAQQSSTFSKTAVLQGENLLLTFTNIGSKTFPRATRALVDMATAMGTDVKGQAIQLGKALNDPIMGISALSRVGVTFTEQQKEMIKTMVEAGDVAGAQGVILDELAKEFGGSAAAQVDTMSRLGNTLNDLFINLGNAITPIVESIGNTIIPVVQQISDGIARLTQEGNPVIGVILAFGAALAIVGPLLIAVGAGITAIVGLLAGPLLPIVLIVGALILLVQHFGITMDQIKLYMSLIQLYVEYYITNIITAVSKVIASIQEWMDKHPALGTALLLIAGFVAALIIAVGVLNVALGVAAGLFGFLLSPIVLLTVAIAGLLFAIEELYPGGITGILTDAGRSASQLGYILQVSLGQAVNWIRNRLADLQVKLIETALTFLDFSKNIANNPLMQSLNPFLKPLADQLNAQYDSIKNVLNTAKAGAQLGQNQQYIAPPPPNFGPNDPGTNAANIAGLQANIQKLVDGLSGKDGKGLTINFQGTGGPTNQEEANNSGFMVVSALRSQGLPV